jgi:hypothetical protein
MTPEAIDTPARTMEQLSIEADEAHKASHPTVKPEDRGIHKDPIERMCDELLAAGFRSATLHPRSPVWYGPGGLKYPLAAAYELMLKQRG